MLLLCTLYIMWSQCRHATVACHFCVIENNFNGCFKVIIIISVCVWGYMYLCVCVCAYTYLCVCVCTFVCVPIKLASAK